MISNNRQIIKSSQNSKRKILNFLILKNMIEIYQNNFLIEYMLNNKFK
jgi:hypothetical protein